MRAIVVAGGVLGLAAAFGLGVIVGRFVLKDDPGTPLPSAALPGPTGLDNPLADPDAALTADPLLNAVAPRPLPPATPPGIRPPPGPDAPTPSDAAKAESEAAMAAGQAAACAVRVSRRMPLRGWNTDDRIVADASGATCGAALVRVTAQSAGGEVLYTLVTAAADYGVAADAGADALRDALERAMPAASVRASAYPAWPEAGRAPQGTEFTREAYEAIRAADLPVVCVKLPTATPRCIAAEPGNGPVKVFQRG